LRLPGLTIQLLSDTLAGDADFRRIQSAGLIYYNHKEPPAAYSDRHSSDSNYSALISAGANYFYHQAYSYLARLNAFWSLINPLKLT
jgi:hypothetical protein